MQVGTWYMMKVESQINGNKDGLLTKLSWDLWETIWKKIKLCSHYIPGRTPMDQKSTRRKHQNPLCSWNEEDILTDLKSTSYNINYKFKCIVALKKTYMAKI